MMYDFVMEHFKRMLKLGEQDSSSKKENRSSDMFLYGMMTGLLYGSLIPSNNIFDFSQFADKKQEVKTNV